MKKMINYKLHKSALSDLAKARYDCHSWLVMQKSLFSPSLTKMIDVFYARREGE